MDWILPSHRLFFTEGGLLLGPDHSKDWEKIYGNLLFWELLMRVITTSGHKGKDFPIT